MSPPTKSDKGGWGVKNFLILPDVINVWSLCDISSLLHVLIVYLDYLCFEKCSDKINLLKKKFIFTHFSFLHIFGNNWGNLNFGQCTKDRPIICAGKEGTSNCIMQRCRGGINLAEPVSSI